MKNPDSVIRGKTGSTAMFFPDRKGAWSTKRAPHTGEHPKGFDPKASERPLLRDILVPEVSTSYDLKGKACFGVTARAAFRGKQMKTRLQMATDEAIVHGLEEVEVALADEEGKAKSRLADVEAALVRLHAMASLQPMDWAEAAEALAAAVSLSDAFGGGSAEEDVDLGGADAPNDVDTL